MPYQHDGAPSRRRPKRNREALNRQIVRFQDKWYQRSVGFTAEQGEVLRYVTDRDGISLQYVLEHCLARYIPRHFGLDWPRATRVEGPRWHLHESKLIQKGRKMAVYALIFTEAQMDVWEQVLARLNNERGAFSALIEDALIEQLPLQYRAQFPSSNRRYIVRDHFR